MKKFLILVLISQFTIVFSQKNVKMYYEQKQDTITYYVDNLEIYPTWITFASQPELENMKKPEVFRTIQILPAKSTKNKVTYFVVNDKKKRWGIKKMPGYMMYMGDITLKSYDTQHQYDLPFQKGKAILVYQGYNSAFSHQNENSLDFVMPEGSEILAAREGLVVDVVQSNNKSCPTRDCAPFGNYVSVMHSDGTIAQYFHLKQNGVKVNIGDTVTKGQTIALSGNTGWSNGPHLHFVTYLPNATVDKNRITVKTLFKTGNGDKVEFLEEKKSYSRAY